MVEMGRFVKPILDMTPPDPTSLDPRGLMRPARSSAAASARCPAHDQYNQVQLMTMSAVDFLDQWFETDVLKATMSASGIIGTFLGVRSPGTAYVLLHHYMGEIDGAFRSWGLSRGGTGAISNAIAAAAREAGVEIRTETPVVEDPRARTAPRVGVVLENGDYLTADVVVVERRPAPDVPQAGRRRAPARRVRRRHAALQVPRLVGQGEPGARRAAGLHLRCPAPGPHLRGAISISPSVDYMERAYDDAKYGRYSRRPYIDIVIPSLTDPSVAPPGKHVMSCFVQYAPYHLREGTWDEQREAFGDTVIEHDRASTRRTSRTSSCTARCVTPLDLEREWGLSEGNIFQGELTLEQLFFLRPAPGWAQLPHADPRPLHVRLGHASRRRHHGRAGAERGDEDIAKEVGRSRS